MTENIVIERAEVSDVNTVYQIMTTAKLHLESPDWYVEDSKEFVREHIDKQGFILLAKKDKKTIGFLLVRIPHNAEDHLGKEILLSEREMKLCAHMESAAVLPEYRGKTIQKRLLKEAENALVQMGYCIFLATVHPDNLASYKSFRASGYQVQKETAKYGGFRRYVMVKRAAVCYNET